MGENQSERVRIDYALDYVSVISDDRQRGNVGGDCATGIHRTSEKARAAK